MVGPECIGVMNGEVLRVADAASMLFSAFFRSTDGSFTSGLCRARLSTNGEEGVEVTEIEVLDSLNAYLSNTHGYGFLTTPHYEFESGRLWLTAGSGTENGFPSTYGVVGVPVHGLRFDPAVDGTIHTRLQEAFRFSTKPTSQFVDGEYHRYVSIRDQVGDYSLVRITDSAILPIHMQVEGGRPRALAYPHLFGELGQGLLFSGGGWGAEGVFLGEICQGA